VRLLGRIHRGFRRQQALADPRLDLDEAEHFPVPAYKVDFAMIVRNAEVAGDDPVALAAKKQVGLGFSLAARMQVRGPLSWDDTLDCLKCSGDRSK